MLVTPSKLKTADDELKKVADELFATDTDIQLASKQYIKTKRKIAVGEDNKIFALNVAVSPKGNGEMVVFGEEHAYSSG